MYSPTQRSDGYGYTYWDSCVSDGWGYCIGQAGPLDQGYTCYVGTLVLPSLLLS